MKYYFYESCQIPNPGMFTSYTNIEALTKVLNEYGSKGYRLHSISPYRENSNCLLATFEKEYTEPSGTHLLKD